MLRRWHAWALTLVLALGIGGYVQAEQSCGGADCRFQTKTPFTHIYEYGSTLNQGSTAGLRIVQSSISSATTSHWVALRTGSITALACNYEISVETTPGKLTWILLTALRGSGEEMRVEHVTNAADSSVAFYEFSQEWPKGVYPIEQGQDFLILKDHTDGLVGTVRKIYCMMAVSGTY